MAHEPGRELVARRRVGVAVDQRRRAGGAQPGERGFGVDVDERRRLARLAPAAASRIARGLRRARARSGSAPGTRAASAALRTCGAIALVVDVVEAQRVAVREQHALAEGDERRSGRRRRITPHAASIASPTQEVAVAGHEADVRSRRGVGQHLDAARLEAALRRMSSPTQTSNRSPRMKTASASVSRMCAAQASKVRGVFVGEVQVGDEVDARASARRASSQLGADAQAALGDAAPRQTTTGALVITTSSSGTSSWKPCCRSSRPRSRRPRPCLRRPCRTRRSPSPAASRALKLRKSLSATLMKNCAVAECGSRGARHRQRVLVVLQAVVGLVRDRRVGRLLLHAGLEAAALDHEARDHAVEHRAVVVAVLDVRRGSSSTVSGAFASSSSMRMCPWWCADRLACSSSFLHGGLLDDRPARSARPGARPVPVGTALDLVDHVHARDDLAEHGVAVAVARLAVRGSRCP